MSVFGNIPSAARAASKGGGRKKKRRGVPTVGRRGSGSVRLTNRVRHNIKHRSNRRAHRYYKPQIQADRAALKGVRRQRRTELQSVTGAVDQASAAISTAEKNAKQSGLKGQYLHQVVQELSARQADLPASASLLQGDIRQQYQSQISSARQAIGTDRVNQSQKAQELFASALSKAQTQARSTVAKRQTAKKDAQSSGKLHDLKIAIHQGAILLHTTPPNKLPWSPQSVKHFGSKQDAWTGFVRELLAQESVSDPMIAQKATEVLRQRLRKRTRKQTQAFETGTGTTGQANVLGG